MKTVEWPSPVLKLAKAISVAEGSPPEWNNPLDMTITLGFPTFGAPNSEGVVKFLNIDDGWYVGRHQCYLMLTGKSHVYHLTDTLEQVGRKYSGTDDGSWARNVGEYLGVPVTTTLATLANT